MLDLIKSWFYPLRIYIPYVIDVIMVSDPEHIKRIEASGDVDRLHTYSSRALPWWVRFYFRATKFYDEERDLWFLPLESTSDPSYAGRRAYFEDKVSTGYTQEDVDRIARLLRANADAARSASPSRRAWSTRAAATTFQGIALVRSASVLMPPKSP